MKIFGHPASTCTRKVLMVLAETDTPYEFELVDFAKGEHKQPANLARQPFGKVPAMDDDGFALYESRAIARYINDVVDGDLIPADAKDRAVVEQWISVETSHFTPSAMKFIFHHIFGYKQDEATLDSAKEQLGQTLRIMDAQLGKQPFFAGDEFTFGDITFMPYVGYLLATPAKDLLADHKNVLAWWKRVSERPTWKKIAG